MFAQSSDWPGGETPLADYLIDSHNKEYSIYNNASLTLYLSPSFSPLAQYLLTQLPSAPASFEHAFSEPVSPRVRIHCVLRDCFFVAVFNCTLPLAVVLVAV